MTGPVTGLPMLVYFLITWGQPATHLETEHKRKLAENRLREVERELAEATYEMDRRY